MNLSNIKLKLFKATITNVGYADYLGIHVGDNLPKDRTILNFNDTLYIAGYSMEDVACLLSKHKIHATNIQEIDVLLTADIKKHQIMEGDIK